MRYQKDEGQASKLDRARVAWWLLRYSVGLLDAPRVAKKAIAGFQGIPERVLAARCEACFARYVQQEISLSARRAVAAHHAAGHLTAIVTAASSYMAWPVARSLGIDHVVATELEVVAATLTGNVHLPLCYGEGKVVRVQQLGQERGFSLDECCFYTDSITDLPLLQAVRRPIVVNPDARLHREARRQGWPIEAW